MKSNPNLPLAQRSPLLTPCPALPRARNILFSLTNKCVVQPQPQYGQIVECSSSYQLLDFERYGALPRAPTGQMSMHCPQNSQSNDSSKAGLTLDLKPRPIK